MTNRPFDIHDFDAAVSRAREVLDELASARDVVLKEQHSVFRGRMVDSVRTLANRVNAALEDLVANLVHDLGVLEAAEEAKRKAEEEHAEQVKKAGLAARPMIDDMLKRLQTGEPNN